jgi:hypothetical protein
VEKSVPRQAILYLSHVVNRTLWRAYKRLERECGSFADVYFVLNLSSDSVPPDVKGTFPIRPAQRAALGHPSRSGIVGWWMDTAPSHTRNIQSGIDQALLAFRQIKPEYDYYWIVEYDVEFSGRWSELFNAFADNTSDLLCSSVHRHETNPTWCWWKSLKWPHNAKPELIRGFFPFARLSAQAIDAIIAAGQNGIDGIYEVVWPTVLHHRDLVIEDIGGDGQFVRPGNTNRWYTSTLTDQDLSPGTFVARPIRARPGRKPNKLWHPVKPRFVRYVLSRLILRMSPSRRAG